MKGWVIALLAIAMAAGCAVAGLTLSSPTGVAAPDPTAVPTEPPTARPISEPSGSCIFTLDIANETSYLVRVQINGTNVTTVESHATLRLMDHDQRLPPMPWDVVLVEAADGRPIASASFTADELEGQLTARDQEASRSSRECRPG